MGDCFLLGALITLPQKKHQQKNLPDCSKTTSKSSTDSQKALYWIEEYSLWQK